jgi:hypothetical protein
MKLPRGGVHLQCDAGAVLHYTGTGDAILLDLAHPDDSLSIDGEGGCLLRGNPRAANGIHLMASNSTAVTGMRIVEFPHGNGIALSGANSVQILRNTIRGTAHGIDMTTVPHYAPNAVHVSYNEISDNDWAVYSHNGHVSATRALGNVYRDNVFENNRSGDLFLSWDAHTVVEGNYFESNGVGVSAGMDRDNVFDIQVAHNYFTAPGYRSEIELGYGFGFHIEQNYEEGGKGAQTGCAVNAMPGILGNTREVTLRDAFSRSSEGITSPHELCFRSSPTVPASLLAETRVAGGATIDGTLHATAADVEGPLKVGSAQIQSTTATIHAGDTCSPEGALMIATPPSQAAQLFFCSAAHWQQVVPPR